MGLRVLATGQCPMPWSVNTRKTLHQVNFKSIFSWCDGVRSGRQPEIFL